MANANEFFDGLGETLTRTAKGLGEKAGQLYETQKLRSSLSAEERNIGKLKSDIGQIMYRRFRQGEVLDAEIQALCEQIEGHRKKAAGYKDAIAAVKGQKVCPSCEKLVDRNVSFCPYCGAACPNVKTKEQTDTPLEAVDDSELEEEAQNSCCESTSGQTFGEKPVEEPGEESVEEPQK